MTSAEFDKLTDLQQDEAAQAALQLVLQNTPRSSPQWIPLTHALAVVTVRIGAARKAGA